MSPQSQFSQLIKKKNKLSEIDQTIIHHPQVFKRKKTALQKKKNL